MAAERVTLKELVAQKSGCLNEDEVWCILSEAALSLLHTLETDPSSWVGGPSLLITPDTFLIGPLGVQFCPGVYNSKLEEQSLFMAPELMTYQGGGLEKSDVELIYMFSLGMCITASAMLPQEDGLLMKMDDNSLRDLLMRMGEEDPSARDVTLQEIIDEYLDYKDASGGEEVELNTLLSSDVTTIQDITGKENSHSLARELDEAEMEPALPSSLPPPPPPPTTHPPTAALQRVNSLDSIYRHMSVPEPIHQQKKARLSGMYSRHISSSFDDVSHSSLLSKIPTVDLDTDTSILLGVRRSERPMSTDSTGIPKHLSSAMEYTGSSSGSSGVVQEQLIESDSSTLSETEYQQQYIHEIDTLIKFTQQELDPDTNDRGNTSFLPAVAADTNDKEDSSLIPRSITQDDPPPSISNGLDDPKNYPIYPGVNEQESPRERALPLAPINRFSQLSSSPSRTVDSPSMREDRARGRRSGTDLLTLSQALEAGVELPVEGHSGTESGDELTPTVVRKKRGTRRKLSDHEVYVFEPTYDEEWQNLENREESMIKLRKILGPDFQKLTGTHPLNKPTDTSPLLFTATTLVDRRDVEVILLNSKTFIANVDENSLVLDLFQQVVAFLSLQEPENFSLAIIQQGEEVFLDPEVSIFKYAPKGWIDKPTDSYKHQRNKRRGRDKRFSVYFRVKFFVENVRLLKSRQTRHLYYLQLKKGLLEGRVSCEEEPALALAGLSLQIELGDYRRDTEVECYYQARDYLHYRVLESLPADTISDTLRQMHQSHQGLSRTEAELAYLKQAQKLPEYGLVYHKVLWQKKLGTEEVWAGVSTRGFVLSKIVDREKVPVLSFSWKLIKLMWHRNKRFVIEPQETATPILQSAELVLLTNSYKQSKYLLKLSKQFHSYQILSRIKVAMGVFKGVFDESSSLNLTDSVSFYSSKGSLSTLHSEKSDPYIPPVDTETDLMPLPAGIDIPEEPGLKLMSISLRQAPGFGFGLTVILNPPERTPGLYIQNIAVRGPAHLDGRLKLFDQIMSVNSKPITGNTYKDVLSLLQTSQEIEIIVKTTCQEEGNIFRMETPVIIKRAFDESEEEFEITLKRDLKGDFGFTVEDNYNENGELCVIVREITNRDIAGMLMSGDRILEVNSVRLVSLKSSEIVTLMEAFTDIHIRLHRDKVSCEKRLSQGEELEVMAEKFTPRLINENVNYTDVILNKTESPSSHQLPPSPPVVPPATPEKFMEPEYVEIETELMKLHGSLGLNVNILTRQSGVPVYVSEVVAGSSAEKTGDVQHGDQIVSIDSNELTGMGVDELVDFLGALPDDKSLLIKLRRQSQDLPLVVLEQSPVEIESTPELMLSPRPASLSIEQTITVMIMKDTAGNLGIRLHAVKEADQTTGIYIKEILKGSPASQSAELHPGAKIMSINNQSLTGVDRQKAVSILKKAVNPILLDIIPDPLMAASELSLSEFPYQPLKHVDTKSTLSHESLPGRSISTQELMAVLDSPDVREEHFTITMERGEQGLGLKVISKQIDQTGLLVKSILGDPAMSNGQLLRGDEITAINGVNIQSMKRGEVLPLIKGEPNTTIVLDIKRYIRLESTDTQPAEDREDSYHPEYLPASLLFTQLSTNSYSRPLSDHHCIEHVFEMKLSRESNEKLGIQIGCLPPDHFPTGIFVKHLTDNSVASSDGRLSVDDILLEANGVNLRNLSKEDALEALKQSPREIKFLVARYTPYNIGTEVVDEHEVPPPPESAPPPIPLPTQPLDMLINLDQIPSLATNTDTIVITQSINQPILEPVDPFSRDLLQPSLTTNDLYPNNDSSHNPFLMYKAIQESTVRIEGPYTQLNYGIYPIEDLQTEIKRIHAEMDPESVENDFKEVTARKPDISSSIAKAVQNVKKNRSLRAIPYDKNRVVLNSTDPQDNYTNSSLVQIKVNELEFKYVCTQAPLSSEVGKFWQMIWEQELYVIIILVDQKEFGIRRTPPYWDETQNAELKEEDKMDFGNFSVKMIEENCQEKMSMRGIFVTNKTNGEGRNILQFHYRQWSGTGIPKSVVDFCTFIDYIRQRVGAKEILVHCNVGIGRTGSYCLVDILSKLVKNRVKADVFQLVVTLNSSRMNLIQTKEQYKFGYSALVHLLFERNP
ncbi:hypothetical protein LOD99_4667 [Oopsacas minuta]|uniref:Tyrosine-protein phosphatase non-receptor type 13 n=1 Tax=Oopsacas minuta TaxID=111878 RepID=A0AAV7JTN7_9METZ|nr:hypothetical protein LOD99_4667 [Oopsacas minuta]